MVFAMNNTTARCGLWSRWTGLLNEWEPGTSLALFRIACGLTVLCTIGTVVLHGLAPVIWLDFADGGSARLGEPPWLFELIGGANPRTLWPEVGVAVPAGVAMATGLGGRGRVCAT